MGRHLHEAGAQEVPVRLQTEADGDRVAAAPMPAAGPLQYRPGSQPQGAVAVANFVFGVADAHADAWVGGGEG